MSLYRLGSTSPVVDTSKTAPCVVNDKGEVFIKGMAQKLYYHSKVEMPFFFEDGSLPPEPLPRLGLNMEVSYDGSSYITLDLSLIHI